MIIRLNQLILILLILVWVSFAFAHGMSEAEKQTILGGGNLQFLKIGATHMLTGYDHLLFVFGIVFYFSSFLDVIKYVTAFTIGHSITLITATLAKITLSYYLMDAVIAVSDDIGKKLESLGVEPKRIHVVYNGVDERFFPRDQRSVRTELKLSATTQIVLFVGLLSPVKGVEYLIEAMESLLERDRQSNLQCILIGDGPERQQLEARAKELRIADRCVFLGTVPREEIPSWLCAADVLALPSLSEGRPNVVLEAQACSIPVVATRVGGTPELICDGQTGILVDSGSSMGMAMGLERVLGDPEFGRRIGMQARLGIEKNGPTWQNAALRTIAIYNQLLSQ